MPICEERIRACLCAAVLTIFGDCHVGRELRFNSLLALGLLTRKCPIRLVPSNSYGKSLKIKKPPRRVASKEKQLVRRSVAGEPRQKVCIHVRVPASVRGFDQ